MTGESGGILVIKHGALGDFVLALGPMQAIRAHHPGQRAVLLTTEPLAGFARATGLFEEVWLDVRPKWWHPVAAFALARKLRAGNFARVYDLQTSDRSSFYLRLFGRRKPEWSGIAAGASHPHANPERDQMHTVERQAEQLALAGIERVPPPDLGFAQPPIERFGLDRPFALLVPGGAVHRPAKRWPVESYAVLAHELARAGLTPVLIGGPPEREVAARIARACREVRDLAGDTSLLEIAALARAARVAIGNDTGPMHLIAAAGCPAVVLFSRDSDPALTAPLGPVSVLRKDPLASLSVGEVAHQAMRIRR
jgi:ADP-heptose:LPS heptosyltransferase